MFEIGDVVFFHSEIAGKKKYHLCISFSGHYLFINSPKKRTYPTDFIFPCSELANLEPTESGDSIISCSYVTQLSNHFLRSRNAKKVDKVSANLVRKLFDFIENCDALAEEDKEIFRSSFGDWL